VLGLGFDRLVDILTRLESRAIRVYPRQCSKLRHRRSTCTLCADYCPVHIVSAAEARAFSTTRVRPRHIMWRRGDLALASTLLAVALALLLT